MFPMTVTISNPAQLNAVMAALNVGGIESPKTSPCVGHAVETAKEEAKGKATSTKKETAKTEAKEEPKAETAQAADQKPEALTQMTASEAEKALHGSVAAFGAGQLGNGIGGVLVGRCVGRVVGVAVLSGFGAAKLPDVKPEQFAAVIAACEKAGA